MRREIEKLPPFPNGWYVIEHSDELEPGQLKTKRFMGQDVVIYRTKSGLARVIDA